MSAPSAHAPQTGSSRSAQTTQSQPSVSSSLWKDAVDKYVKETRLTPRDKRDFGFATLEQLQRAVNDIHKKKENERKSQKLQRLQKFIFAMEDYGKVIDTFGQTSEILCYVWGPLKFILIVTNNYANAFNTILDSYERIGEIIPQLTQYQAFFSENDHMQVVLSQVFEDILNFHAKSVQYFQKSFWKNMFDAFRKSFEIDVKHILEKLTRHCHLVRSQASLVDYEKAQRARDDAEIAFRRAEEAEENRRTEALLQWLSPAQYQTDHDFNSKFREENPGSGEWFLTNPKFESWYSPDQCTSPLLWLSGIPGAGKSVLVSLLVEEVRKIQDSSCAYFYCKFKDPSRNNFVALTNAILAQLIVQNKDLLPYLYEKKSTIGGTQLNSSSIAKELLELALGNIKRTYIIIDGLDECERESRKEISIWFKRIVNELPTDKSDKIRCLFTSQDDGAARRDFDMVSHYKIAQADTEQDIQRFCDSWKSKMTDRFKKLSEPEMDRISSSVAKKSEGMFLFAKLVMSNLYAQRRLNRLKEELAPEKFPIGLDQAYERIVFRIIEQRQAGEENEALQLLGWLVCAKRPLKWHEVQGAFCVEIDRGVINRDRELVDSAKELCNSLVEIGPDNTVVLVHRTARAFLETSGHISIAEEEKRIATLCLNYLSFRGFEKVCFEEDILKKIEDGYYAFMEYAVAYWASHTEEAISRLESSSNASIYNGRHDDKLESSVVIFLDTHWVEPTQKVTVPKTMFDRLKNYQSHQHFERLSQAIITAKRQASRYGTSSNQVDVLDVHEVIRNIRRCFETAYLDNRFDLVELESNYGPNFFKCPQVSCVYFYSGFANRDEREEHIQKHERSFLCTAEGCHMAMIGCATQKELEKHYHDFHEDIVPDEDFPPEPREPTPEPTQTVPEEVEDEPEQPSEPAEEEEVPGDPSIPEQSARAAPKRKNNEKVINKRQCRFCNKIFSRINVMKEHERVHTGEKPIQCYSCPARFARLNDMKRHYRTHDDEKEFVCGGELYDGTPWGCGKEFVRADGLKRHHRTQLGQQCIKPYMDEKLQEIQSG